MLLPLLLNLAAQAAIRGADADPEKRKRIYRPFGRSEIERIAAEQAALNERRPEVLVSKSEALALVETQALLRLLAAQKHRTREEEDTLLLLLMSCAAMT